MKDLDCLQRFVFEQFAVRGQIVRLDAAWQSLLQTDNYPPPVKILLGEALAATVLLASTLKFEGRITLQVQGDGPVNLLVMQCTDELDVRGLARWKGSVPGQDLEQQFGAGRLAITIATNTRAAPYQGIVPLTGARFAQCLSSYFDTSEQLPTRIWLTADTQRCAGLLLQRLAGDTDAAADDNWRRVVLLAETLNGTEELSQLNNEQLLQRLYHEDDKRLFDSRPVRFHCNCSQDRIEIVLKALGSTELSSIIKERGSISVVCEFCNRQREFDAIDVERMRRGGPPPTGPASVN